ncbi:ankyrin repeat protein, putative [Trichomonas vaginalis G3]|uniref:Ankyrin repeat protein, putative n=1 Tax=Trichomonas vaginalis (strain ATCC PRA-98 / G3) TaxID=412133 RepID=A2FUU6_TRIV3|nr:proteasome regulatory particle assembly [Trichomonas vaginalis G3]EAX91335.1 ankyrin repeat protein, putative [Trichomonas vaginalis G3]KAI5547556.1 proteasome regulatory particle assembly [Trichomonas vaginalis G3]|eukprot:XP_001304265.1 ankyrin repeat protein [Trichomonas vaginalis G3]
MIYLYIYLKNSSKVQSKKFNILHAIYYYKIPKTIICAIESGANITITDSFNEGALHLAAKHKLKEVAEHLISHGLDINAKDKNGKTPLHYAAGKSLDMVEFLISHGADINATTRCKGKISGTKRRR